MENKKNSIMLASLYTNLQTVALITNCGEEIVRIKERFTSN